MKHTYLYAIFLSVLFIISSCVQDDPIGGGGVTQEEQETNEWIYDKLSDYYLWYDEMPAEENVRFSSEPESFFYSLLSKKDGKTYSSGTHYYYSSISPKSGVKSYQGDELSFGFEYQAWQDTTQKPTLMALQILYVLPDSPASGTLKRGDWILKINNTNVSSDYYDVIKNSNELTFGVADKFTSSATVRESFTLSKRQVTDNPVFKSTIITEGSTKVGYLAYNHFTAGPNGSSDDAFDVDMVNAVKDLASKGAQEFILDLRYNGGGYVSSAQKLASALAPGNALEKVFCKLTMNDKHSNEDSSMKLASNYHAGLSLNNNRLFVITSSRTASASELVIAGLQPYMTVTVVGETTEGKNVGSREFKDDDYNWILHPIICDVTNANGDDYSAGLPPKYKFYYSKEASLSSEKIHELGDPKEEILKGILEIIGGSTPSGDTWKAPRTKANIYSEDNLTPLGSSLDRKTRNAVILN